MGIHLQWDDDAHTILRCAFDPQWTWDDLYAIADEVKAITDNAPQTISAIIDLTDGMTIPGGNFFSPTSLENARKLLTLGEGGTGPIVIVGANSLIKMVYTSFKGMDKRAAAADVTFTDTLDEARAHLATIK
jgi:ABC-type glycerol-3-phosphate transport system substrate-binding protein